MIERDEELAALGRFAREASLQSGNIVLLSGEAGLGKTTLLNAFRDKVGSDYTVLWGGCDPFETPRPLGPIYDLTYALLDPSVSYVSDEGGSGRFFAAILAALESSQTPSLLILEDAHWADNATLDFIRYLGRRIRFLKAALIISYRDDEIGLQHPLRTAIGDLPQTSIRRIALKPLSKSGVKKLAKQSGVKRKDLHRVTNGNPFFVTELLAAGSETDSDVPVSIREAVNARLNRLSKPDQTFLETISLIPTSIPLRLLSFLFGDQAKVLAQNCVDRNLLIAGKNGEDFRFRHELARLTTMERVKPDQQQSVHLRLLDYLKDHDPRGYGEIMHHASGAHHAEDILTYAPLAAKQAAQVGAHREAADYLATALRYAANADLEDRAQFYESWAYEAAMALQIDEAVIEARRKAIDIWRRLDRPEKIGQNYQALSRLHWYRGESDIAKSYSDQAIDILEQLPPSADQAMSYSIRSQIDMLNDNMDQAVEWGQRALDLAEQFDDVNVKVHALNNVGTALVFRGDTSGVPMLEQSLSLALSHDLHEDAARAYTNLSEYGLEFGDYDLAEKTLQAAIRFSNQHDIKSFTPYLSGRLAQLKLERGLYGEAEIIAKSIVDQPGSTLLMQLPARIVMAKCHMRMGQDNAKQRLDDALERALDTGELQYIIPARLAHMEYGWIIDDADLAEPHFEAIAKLEDDKLHPWNRGQFLIWSKRLEFNVQPLLRNHAAQPFHLELTGQNTASAEFWETAGAPYSQALALLQDQSPDAATSLSKAINILQLIEAYPVADKARAMATKRGLNGKLPKARRGPYAAARAHPLGLTKKEQQVLIMMTKGATNRDIAEEFSRSPRTVDNHVSKILKKLDVDNRLDAVMRVTHEPWLYPNIE